ncbi:MAG: single-stranded-DNA-specific exonuclease RecJ [Candidatus Adiutrix sp.]|jgi:single-stranded-DNA-specific exonuclease|nr:single-stranded-DNA-specific exonuclease RecJ [Candidatus Adiutrix sp.]
MIWRLRNIDRGRAAALAQALGQPLKLGEFLAARGFREAEEVKTFIRADLKSLPPPASLTDMDKAAERLARARREDELVAVCGDYDADGLTAAALLTRGLGELGHRTLTRIPHRLTDGYGLKPSVMQGLAEKGVTLVVTVDNGISDSEAVEAAVQSGIDVIITDHHHLPPELPPAVAIVDPHRDPLWRDHPPAGVGVAFLLLCVLKRLYQQNGLLAAGEGPSLMDYLPLVAIGTVADLAPLVGPNRVLVRHGLAFLGTSKQPGLNALKKIARISGERVSPRDVGFRLAPRLNAAGRLGSADPALELLLADDERQAQRLATKLEELNRERYQGQNRLCAEALERLEEEISPDRRTVVLGGENWPRGLLGLAASRVAESAQKPTVLFSLENGLAVGSGRSAGNFNLYKALNALRHLFISFGGHSQAAGMTLESHLLDEFAAGLENEAQGEPDFQPEAELLIDMEAGLGDLGGLARSLAVLEPFGQGHPAPVLMVRSAKIAEARPTDSGGESHMKMVLGEGLNRQSVVGFGLASRLCEVQREMDVALTLDISEFRGQLNPAWRLLDFRAPEDR